MGASKYKQQRVTERESGLSARAKAESEALQKKKRDRILYIVVGVLLVVFIAGVIFVNSSYFTNGLAAVKVKDASYSVADVRYMTQASYNQFYNNYSDYISYFIDTSVDLSEQECILEGYEGKTWEDYFQDQAVENLRDITALSDQAKAEGYALSEEDQEEIDYNITMLSLYASLYGYTTDGYIAMIYGEGNSEKSVRELMELTQLADSYASDKEASYSYTDAELDAYYADVAGDYNSFTYGYYFVSAGGEEELESARETAQAIVDASGKSVEAFQEAVLAVTGEEATTQSSAWTNVSDLKDWFTDPARQSGDVTTVETSSGIRLYCFDSIETNDYPIVNVRHILVTVEDTDGDGEVSDEEKAAALSKIQDIQAEWDGTEEGFIALVEEYSEDSGSNTTGGLYEHVYKGEMVPEFDEFCFEPHEYGDTGIVYSEYTGYHLIFFVGEGELYSRYIADSLMRDADYTVWLDALIEEYPARRTFMFRYV